MDVNLFESVQVNRLVKDIIPEAVLFNAAGFALLSQLKVGLGLWSCRVGTGVKKEMKSWPTQHHIVLFKLC